MRTLCAVGGGHLSFPVLLLYSACNWLCLIASLELRNPNPPEYCMLWHEPDRVIVASGHRLFQVYLAENDSNVLPLLEWPTDQILHTLTSGRRADRCNAAIKWVAKLFQTMYEVCGSVGRELQCHVYRAQDNSWTWISTRRTAFHADYHSLLHNYVDGYSLLAYSPLNGGSPVIQLRSTPLQNPSNPTVRSEVNEEKSIWWNPILETSNHNQMQLAISPKVKFHHVISAPGRRYLVFQEPGSESYVQQALWSQQTEDIIYTRIARLCTGDPGLRSPKDGKLLITSFFKARLICRIRSDNSKHSLRFNQAGSGYNYQPSEVHFNYPISITQSFMTGLYTEPVVYGLFAAVDPDLIQQMPERLTQGLYTFGPLALCAYRLAAIDNLVRSSDLIQLIPSYGRDGNMVRSAENVVYNVSGTPISTSSVPINSRVTRIRRIHSDNLETITDCPGPSKNNRRLALEAPLLANAILPHTGQALGLLHLRSAITIMIADPRSFIRRSTERMHLNKTHWSQVTLQVLYIGTRKGEVFKLLLLMPGVQPDNPTAGTGQNERTSSSDTDYTILASGQLHVIQRLFVLPVEFPIRSIGFVQLDANGAVRHVPLPASSPLQAHSTLEVYTMNGAKLVRFPVANCSQARSCRQCVALRDPDCFWDSTTGHCSTAKHGLQNVWTGLHPNCDLIDQSQKAEAQLKPETEKTPGFASMEFSADNSPLNTVVTGFASSTDLSRDTSSSRISQPSTASISKGQQWLVLWLTCTGLFVCIIITWLLTRWYYQKQLRSRNNGPAGRYYHPHWKQVMQLTQLCDMLKVDSDLDPNADSHSAPTEALCSCRLLTDSFSSSDNQKLTSTALVPSPPATVHPILPHRLVYRELDVHDKRSPHRFQCKTDRPASRLGTLCLNNDLRSEEDTAIMESFERFTETAELHVPG